MIEQETQGIFSQLALSFTILSPYGYSQFADADAIAQIDQLIIR